MTDIGTSQQSSKVSEMDIYFINKEIINMRDTVKELKLKREQQDKTIKDQQLDIYHMRNMIIGYETEIMKLKAQLNNRNISYSASGKKFEKSISKECANGCGFVIDLTEKSEYCSICREHIAARKKRGINLDCGYCISGHMHNNQDCIYS